MNQLVAHLLKNDEARILSRDERYAISRAGEVFSRARFSRWNNEFTDWKKSKIAFLEKYPAVAIGAKKTKIHHLVAETFIGPRNNQLVRHLDDNPLNNHVSNLAYGTLKQNAEDAVKNRRSARGEKHPKARLTEFDVRTIRDMIASGYMQKHIAIKFNCHPDTISSINRGSNWSWLL